MSLPLTHRPRAEADLDAAFRWYEERQASRHLPRCLDWPGHFVPMVQDGVFERMIDRQAMIEQVARWFIAEQA